MDESKVIAAVRSGQIDQFAQLVERYHIGLVIYCERMLGDRDDAEDVAQSAFIKAYQQLPHFNAERARFSTWLYRIATNLAIDYLRQHKRVQPHDNIETLEPTTPDALQAEMLREVRSAVLALMPSEQRRVIEAFYWEGKSCQAIAEELDVPLNTVKSWLRRAKAQLRRKLS